MFSVVVAAPRGVLTVNKYSRPLLSSVSLLGCPPRDAQRQLSRSSRRSYSNSVPVRCKPSDDSDRPNQQDNHHHDNHHRDKAEVETSPSFRQVITGNVPRGGKGIAAGQVAESKRTFTPADVNAYAALVGDPNPLHQSSSSTSTQQQQQQHQDNQPAVVVVHGMLVASLFSHIFGSLIPGAIYRQQSLKFRNFVHVNCAVVGRIQVLEVRPLRRGGTTRIVHCATNVYDQETKDVYIEGEAQVVLTEE